MPAPDARHALRLALAATTPPHRATAAVLEALPALATDGAWDAAFTVLGPWLGQLLRQVVQGQEPAAGTAALARLDAALADALPTSLPATTWRALILTTSHGHSVAPATLVAGLPTTFRRHVAGLPAAHWDGAWRHAELREVLAASWGLLPFAAETWAPRWQLVARHTAATPPERLARALLVHQWRAAGAPATPAPPSTWIGTYAAVRPLEPWAYHRLLQAVAAGGTATTDTVATDAAGTDLLPLEAFLQDHLEVQGWLLTAVAHDHDPGTLLAMGPLGARPLPASIQTAFEAWRDGMRRRVAAKTMGRVLASRVTAELEAAGYGGEAPRVLSPAVPSGITRNTRSPARTVP